MSDISDELPTRDVAERQLAPGALIIRRDGALYLLVAQELYRHVLVTSPMMGVCLTHAAEAGGVIPPHGRDNVYAIMVDKLPAGFERELALDPASWVPRGAPPSAAAVTVGTCVVDADDYLDARHPGWIDYERGQAVLCKARSVYFSSALVDVCAAVAAKYPGKYRWDGQRFSVAPPANFNFRRA